MDDSGSHGNETSSGSSSLESNPAQNPPLASGSAAGCASGCTALGVDVAAIVARAKSILLSPRAALEKLKSEEISSLELLRSYVAPLVAAGAVAKLLGGTIVGHSLPFVGTFRDPFFSALVFQTLFALALIAVLWGSAQILATLAPKFNGSAEPLRAFKWVVFAATPALVGALLLIVPSLGVLGILFALYGLYLFFVALPAFCTVPSEKRTPYLATSLGGTLVLGLIVFLVVGLFAPKPPIPDELQRGLEKGLEKLKELERILPKPPR